MMSSVFPGQVTFSLDYKFNEKEILSLAKFFRKNQAQLPDELTNFAIKIERAVYDSMSIDEAESFFS